jgi:hypothetical protein
MTVKLYFTKRGYSGRDAACRDDLRPMGLMRPMGPMGKAC